MACSLDAINHTIPLNSSGIPLSSGTQPTDVAWSAFSPAGDLNLTSAVSSTISLDGSEPPADSLCQISYAMRSANSLPSSPYCQPIMSENPAPWVNITVFNAYVVPHLAILYAS